MKKTRLGTLLIIFVCALAAAGQRVDESASRLIVQERTADVTLAIESQTPTATDVRLRILDDKDNSRAELTQRLALRRGVDNYKLTIPTGDLANKQGDDLAWYRLEYRVGSASGLISLSQLMKDDFDLRAAASERIVPGQPFTARVRALNPVSEEAVKDVKVKVELALDIADKDKKLTLTANGRTGSNGLAEVVIQIPETIKLGDDSSISITGQKNGVVRKIDEDLNDDNARSMVYMTPDKPLYQPGQTFNLRALYFDANNTVVTDSELAFTIEDSDDKVVFRKTIKTSLFGIAAISWPIPENTELGSYTVRVEGDSELREPELRFKVMRYDLPNFKVAVTPDKTYYLMDESTANVTVNADYLFGKPVPNGKVRVVEESDRHWNSKTHAYDVDEAQTVEGTADAAGRYIAPIDLSKDSSELRSEDWERYKDVSLAAYVTDPSTNRTEQRRFDIRITKQPIHIYFFERSTHRSDMPATTYISTFYADGAPAMCNVDIDDANGSVAHIKTNKMGAAKVNLRLRPSTSKGSYDIQVKARDDKGREGTSDESIYVSDSDAVQIRTDKAIYKPGEMIEVDVVSNRQSDLIYVDIAKDWTVLDPHTIRLRNGKAHLTIPYRPEFKGDLTIAAYGDRDTSRWSRDMYDARGIVFPEQQNLVLDAKFSKAEYRPAENALLKFTVRDGSGRAVQSAIGLSVFDKAIEERARTDSEFGGYFGWFYNLMGYGHSYGGVTLNDLNDLDLTKPIPDELQLAAELMLADRWYYPSIFHSGNHDKEAGSLYSAAVKAKLKPVDTALKAADKSDGIHPTDAASLKAILKKRDIDYDSFRDPWGNSFVAEFTVDRMFDVLTLRSAGPDKQIGTPDDFAVLTESFEYFTRTAAAIDHAAQEFHARTGGYIRDLPTLTKEFQLKGIDLARLKDKWGRDLHIDFGVRGRTYTIEIASLGPNGIFEPSKYNSDDFVLASSAIDYFGEVESSINAILDAEVNRQKHPFPRTEAEFIAMLSRGGLDLSKIKDGYGQPVILTAEKTTRYSDKTVTTSDGHTTITPVTEELMVFHIRGTANDEVHTDLAVFSGAITEAYAGNGFEAAEVKTIPFTGAMGAIKGTVTDAQGAVISGAQITATDQSDETKKFEAKTDENGDFLIGNVPSGQYRVKVQASGFQLLALNDVLVRSHSASELKLALRVGAVSATVTVTGTTNNYTVDSTSTSVSTRQLVNLPKSGSHIVIPDQQTSTPRLREYFPETLFWEPELVTDSHGRAEANFKMADNITTWKMFAIASTKKGKIGVVEKEVTSFQPFFVDLDPPKFLTQGDEIYLPTQVRNYTDRQQKVDVSMDAAAWFTPISTLKQSTNVDAGSSANAVFGFRASQPVIGGKQRVTAIAKADSDAIEKPVTVRPNGQEIVRPESKIFSGSTAFDLSFPAEALPGTPRAELKIYPNLFSHLSESVEGLLERPYGCGEQTISSTYPNLMILKFVKADTPLTQKARKYLQKGYERLLGYQSADGGFTYWGGKSEPDAALTAYAIRFVNDANGTIEVDDDVITKAATWLIKQQRPDGSWEKRYTWESDLMTANRTKQLTGYIAHVLAVVYKGKPQPEVLTKALAYLKQRNSEIDEPYALALYGLASLESGDADTAKRIATKLESMAIPEGSAAYWKLETNTPFYGWGTAGRIETTALVVKLLVDTGVTPTGDTAASKGLQFLLKNKDRYGVWYSTQATINVLDALLTTLDKQPPSTPAQITVAVNGRPLAPIDVPADQITPLTIQLSGSLAASASNRIELRGPSSMMMAQLVATHYIDWRDSHSNGTDLGPARELKLDYKCDKLQPAVMEDVTCSVDAERVGYRGYGMLLAEIGTPPGAEVSRESLEAAIQNDWNVSHYDILPDRIVLYMWASPGGTHLKFKFRERYRVNAQTPASTVYDYYNPDARALVPPLRFATQ